TNGVQIVGTGSDKNAWYQQGIETGNNRCTAKLTNMKTYANFVNSGVQSQYLVYTVATLNYTKLSIGNITTENVDNYSIRLNCSGSTNQTITVHANDTIDITPYNSVTVTIEIQKNATLGDTYLGGEDNPPKIMISYMNFD
ncbi:MAG: hypothetical protein K2I72_01875, partial [Bacilli bacterium]|nr:hypothetical protein [Bacilli bacterium]